MDTLTTMRCCRCPRKGLTVKDFAKRGLRILKHQPNVRSGVCKACIAAHNKKYYALNIERERARAKQKHLEDKCRVIEHYGGECGCCGEKELVFLQIDHINNDGAAQRKKLGSKAAGSGFLWWVIKHKFPSGLQVLCANCHQAKSSGVICPHKR